MLPEDERRLQREADIARSVRGLDYSKLEQSIAKNKAEFRAAQRAQSEANAKVQALGNEIEARQSASGRRSTAKLEVSRRQITAHVQRQRSLGFEQ
ncbi:MAG: hypothetical protein AAF950_04620 [Pseudomonadota bacterium]